jgi:uncharacterized protein (TIGR02271 family)
MTHTVVGLFDNKSEAQSAMQELVQQGFVKEHIDVSNRRLSESTSNISDNDSIGDSISNFFSSLFGGDETAARSYTNAARDAEAILTVQVDSAARAEKAREILDRNGAFDVDERGARYSQQNYAQTSGKTENRARTEGETSIPVIEEELKVGKKQVERGGARIRSRIIERPVEESVRLREEHLVVNRHPVNRAATQADLANIKEGDIELTERAEVPVVGKQARVVEEVEIGKNVTEHEETVRDTVRKTDVEVQETDTDVNRSANVNKRSAKG